MEVRVLGPIEAVGPDGAVVAFRGRLGCLVAALVARRGHPVPVDVLVDDVFGELPPRSASSTMHGYVHRVRRRVPGLVASGPFGYRLDDAVSVDAACFEAECRAGVTARRAGAPGRALERFDAALAHWRGPAFAEYADRGFAEAAAAGLEELRRAAEDERLAILVESGPPELVLAELETAALAEPSRERRWALLVGALARAGRPSEAARVAEQFRRWLRDECGAAPTAAFESSEVAALGSLRALPGLDAGGGERDVERVVAAARAALHETSFVPVSVAGEAALEAGARLVMLGELEAADRWFGEVVGVLERADPGRAARAHLARADVRAHRETADWMASVQAAVALAERLDDSELLVSAALLNPSGVATGAPTRVPLLRVALDRAGTGHPRRAALLAQLALELVDPRTREEQAVLMDDALTEARRSGDHATRMLVTASRLNDSQRFLSPDERAALADELDEAAGRFGRGDAAFLAAAHRYWSAVQRACPHEATTALRAVAVREGSRREYGRIHRLVPHMQAIDALLAGRLDDADDLLGGDRDAHDADDDVLGTSQANRHGVLLRLRREQGRMAELLPMLEGDLRPFAALLAPSDRALVLAELGHADAARAALARCRADSLCPPLYLPHVWTLRIEAAALAGDGDRAEADAERLRPHAGQVLCGTRGCDGAVDRYLGLAALAVGDGDGGDRWLASAVAIHERLGSPTLLARTLHDRARLLDDRAAGARAEALARRHGLTALASVTARRCAG